VGIGGDETTERIPLAFGLEQNFPNPFNPQTRITFQVDESTAGQIEVSVYSLRGTRVRTLLSRHLDPGKYTVVWDGRNGRGEQLPSGVYFYRLTADGNSVTRKMVLAK
jgi:flagellar hook assembly protein FlgD